MFRTIWMMVIMVGILTVLHPVSSWSELADPPHANVAASKEKAAKPLKDTSPVIEQDEAVYRIGPGDVLDISVWKDEALTRSCIVRPDGEISFPLIGDIQAAGKTAMQLRAEMSGKLNRYVPDLTLSLEVKQINSLIIYVIGKVNAPGRFVLNANVNVLQALSIASGLNPFAKRNGIRVFRQGKNETTIFPFEYDEVVSGNRLEQNIRLQKGDIVVVP
jgi:polysaccharide export outer membrane protein